jgi:hypothetical protein
MKNNLYSSVQGIINNLVIVKYIALHGVKKHQFDLGISYVLNSFLASLYLNFFPKY